MVLALRDDKGVDNQHSRRAKKQAKHKDILADYTYLGNHIGHKVLLCKNSCRPTASRQASSLASLAS